jgi:hypothetical protein
MYTYMYVTHACGRNLCGSLCVSVCQSISLCSISVWHIHVCVCLCIHTCVGLCVVVFSRSKFSFFGPDEENIVALRQEQEEE